MTNFLIFRIEFNPSKSKENYGIEEREPFLGLLLEIAIKQDKNICNTVGKLQ